MENKNTPTRLHPLVAGAAISVMLVSLTGVAAITGLLPNSHSSATPSSAAPTVAQSVGAATAAASPAALVENKQEPEPKIEAAKEPPPQAKQAPAEKRNYAPRTAQTQPTSQPRKATSNNSNMVAQAPAICHSCGRVESVQAIQQAAEPSGVGMVAGAVLGGVLGNQVGGGNGKKLATVAGAIGGGYAGNAVEKHTRSTTTYQVRVRMEDGDVRTFSYPQQPAWSTGDRVRVVDGQLTSRA